MESSSVVGVTAARSRLAELIGRAREGERIALGSRGRPEVLLVPASGGEGVSLSPTAAEKLVRSYARVEAQAMARSIASRVEWSTAPGAIEDPGGAALRMPSNAVGVLFEELLASDARMASALLQALHDALVEEAGPLAPPPADLLEGMALTMGGQYRENLGWIERELSGLLPAKFARRTRAEVEWAFARLVGHEVDLGDLSELRAVLYDELGLPVVKTTSVGPSVDEPTLRALRAATPHEAVDLVLEWRAAGARQAVKRSKRGGAR